MNDMRENMFAFTQICACWIAFVFWSVWTSFHYIIRITLHTGPNCTVTILVYHVSMVTYIYNHGYIVITILYTVIVLINVVVIVTKVKKKADLVNPSRPLQRGGVPKDNK